MQTCSVLYLLHASIMSSTLLIAFWIGPGILYSFFVAVFCFLFSKRYKIWCIETINMNLYTPHFFWGCIISFSLQKCSIITFWLSFLWKLKRDYFFYQWWCLKVFRISNLFLYVYLGKCLCSSQARLKMVYILFRMQICFLT